MQVQGCRVGQVPTREAEGTDQGGAEGLIRVSRAWMWQMCGLLESGKKPFEGMAGSRGATAWSRRAGAWQGGVEELARPGDRMVVTGTRERLMQGQGGIFRCGCGARRMCSLRPVD